MKIFPAIDLKDGKCVRLIKGDFGRVTEFDLNPLNQAMKFEEDGFQNLHIVDLDGALSGESVNGKFVEEIAQNTKLKIELGGGIRSLANIEYWLSRGVDKVILGTIAVENLQIVKEACENFRDRIVVGIDSLNGFVATRGWKEVTNLKMIDMVDKIANFGVSYIIHTDINRDGILSGIDLVATKNLAENLPIPIVISGGVASINDLNGLLKLNLPSIYGVIIGRALYEGRVKISELHEFLN